MKSILWFIVIYTITLITNAQTAKNIALLSNIVYTSDLSNIGGYSTPTGQEYALIGWEKGLSIVNVTNPYGPVIDTNIAGPTSIWREVKTYKDYAYVVTEGGGGVTIVNLNSLPNVNGIVVTQFTPTVLNDVLSTTHSLHIDTTKGNLYLYGSNVSNQGALVFSLADPINPTYLGAYDLNYIHDGYVDNDTLFACHVYEGYFSVIDMKDKNMPSVIATQHTPSNFTHNSWLSTNKKTLFTTDEVDNSYLTAYDISDLNSITELDRIQSQNTGSNSIVHNTHILNDWAITSWYKDGVVITDVHRPENMVNVAWYDTSPLSGGGFDGAWGVYPFLPSGNILVSDISEGLFVLKPTYKRACYLEGLIKDSTCNGGLNNVKIFANNGTTTFTAYTAADGNFKTGGADSGYYTITISKPGYITQTITNVFLNHGIVTNLNLSLYANQAVNFTGKTEDSNNNNLPNCNVTIEDSVNTYSFTSNNVGEFYRCNLINGTYNIYAGKWGYLTYCNSEEVIDVTHANKNIQLIVGYKDDFSINQGWTVASTATSGEWTRDIPVGTTYSSLNDCNPNNDAEDDCSNKAFITGNGGGVPSDDDIDDGATILYSPLFDLTAINDPYINYERWFFNAGGGTIGNDSLIIYLTDGIKQVALEKVVRNTPGHSTWKHSSFRVADYLTPTSTMRLIVHAEDYAPGHLVEAGFDNFVITSQSPLSVENKIQESTVSIYPNPSCQNFYIQGNKNIHTMIVRNVIGETVEAINVNNIPFLSFGGNYVSGIYFVTIKNTDNSYQTIKIVKTE